MDAREQNERIRSKNCEAAARAYENMNAALGDKTDHDGINAVLKFLNEHERVDDRLPLSEQLRYIEEKLYIKTRYTELDADWYTTCALPMLVKTTDGHWFAVIPSPGGTCSYIDKGKRIKLTHRNAARFTSDSVCFYKGMGPGRIGMKGLIAFMIKCCSKKDALAVVLASVFTLLSGMLLPWVNSFIFSRIIPAGETQGDRA